MSKKIFVGNLKWETTEFQLKDLFSKYGTVTSARVITEKETGRSRGFAFVEMQNNAEAEKALAELNGTELQGRNINVNEALKK